MTAYYNEINPFMAEWLRNLIAGDHIAPGIVDERSIEDVIPDELREFTQCHFFAGLGGWSYALRLAGWPDNKPVWTASCPCQPFSSAGAGAGFDDPRHLWPHFAWQAKQRRPIRIFGEQSSSGRANAWFDLVQNDLEKMGYTFGLVPFPSACVGAPHERERAYWVADTNVQHESSTRNPPGIAVVGRRSPAGRVAYADNHRQQPGEGRSGCGESREARNNPGWGCSNVGDRPGPVNGFWRDADWLSRRDDKWCPAEPSTFPLVDGVSARLGRVQSSISRMAGRNRAGRIKGYGNAINPHAAAAFIRSYIDSGRTA